MGDGDDGGDDDGRISPEHPSPILHAPRDIISRKGKSLTPTIFIELLFRRFVSRLVIGYGVIGMIGVPKEYGRYMHQYTYSMHIC